ncbi:DgyrCDS14112 [Dimorphilus gyrociliatus]|uniref:DgyrCDS14112 n=1 Tax=Dimorphilus gyrociliatus TaxID=2664684 RepID=A0A7I8WCW6_9ANNE|nr:DgyrCDS14112 [Dimorphilus gyrociliatus]
MCTLCNTESAIIKRATNDSCPGCCLACPCSDEPTTSQLIFKIVERISSLKRQRLPATQNFKPNLAETNPAEFHRRVTDRLNDYLRRSRESRDHLRRLKDESEDDRPLQNSTVDYSSSDNSLIHPDDPQNILDEHVFRVFSKRELEEASLSARGTDSGVSLGYDNMKRLISPIESFPFSYSSDHHLKIFPTRNRVLEWMMNKAKIEEESTVVGYFLFNEEIPYKFRMPGRNITLAQIKEHIRRGANCRFFVKKHSEEFGVGVVHEEVTNENEPLPLFDGKIVLTINKLD